MTLERAAAVTLPCWHRDPLDRLLVAQASVEAATLVSGDASLRQYGVALVWR